MCFRHLFLMFVLFFFACEVYFVSCWTFIRSEIKVVSHRLLIWKLLCLQALTKLEEMRGDLLQVWKQEVLQEKMLYLGRSWSRANWRRWEKYRRCSGNDGGMMDNESGVMAGNLHAMW